MERLRLATVWLGGRSGCHMSFLDLDEWLIDLARMADIVFTPLADIKVFPEKVDGSAISRRRRLTDAAGPRVGGLRAYAGGVVADGPRPEFRFWRGTVLRR